MWIIPPCAVADMNLLTPLRNDAVWEKNTAVLLKNSPQIDAIFPPVLLMVTDRFFSACPNQTRPFAVFSVTVIWISPHIRRLCFDASGDPYGSFNRRCKCERFRRCFNVPVIAVRVRCQATLCILLEFGWWIMCIWIREDKSDTTTTAMESLRTERVESPIVANGSFSRVYF